LAAVLAGCPATRPPDPPTTLNSEEKAAALNKIVAAVAARPKQPVDNSFCYVCHGNYKSEPLARRHLKAKITCSRCHGSSDDHSADEDGLTPPQIMFPKDAINPTCMICHKVEKLAAVAAHEKVLVNRPDKPACTDCHGKNHRMAHRTRVWDRWTGKLVRDDGVRLMKSSGGK